MALAIHLRSFPTNEPRVPALAFFAETSRCLGPRAGGSLERGSGPALPHRTSGGCQGRAGDTPNRRCLGCSCGREGSGGLSASTAACPW